MNAGMSATAYERIVDKLCEMDLKVRPGTKSVVALCPSHDDRQPSLAVYDKGGKAKIICFAGCDDALDILPALDMTVPICTTRSAQARALGQAPTSWHGPRPARP
jgi:hypothetical protein